MDTMGAWAREGAEGWLSGLGCGFKLGQAPGSGWDLLDPPTPLPLGKVSRCGMEAPRLAAAPGPPCASVSPLRSERGAWPVWEGGEGMGSGHVCTAEALGRGQGSEVLLPPPSAGGR